MFRTSSVMYSVEIYIFNLILCITFYAEVDTFYVITFIRMHKWAWPWKTWLSPFFVFRIDLFRSAMENITNKPTNAI